MALNISKCNRLMPLHFKGSIMSQQVVHVMKLKCLIKDTLILHLPCLLLLSALVSVFIPVTGIAAAQ